MASLSSNVADDITAPEIEKFLLDLNSGLLNLQFSEAINLTAFDYSNIILQTQPAVLSEAVFSTLPT